MNDYQKEAIKTAAYPNVGSNWIYPLIGLGGEVGELQNFMKKIIRDKHMNISSKDRENIKCEIGGVYWYLAILAYEFGFTSSEIAEYNIAQLKSRQERGVIQGSGNDR